MATNVAQAGCSILDLNSELLDKVLQHLSLVDLSNLHETCTQLQTMIAHRFEKLHQDKLNLGYCGIEQQLGAVRIVSDADIILQSFGRYIEALSVKAFWQKCENELGAVSDHLLNIIQAGLTRAKRSSLNYLKLDNFHISEESIRAFDDVIKMTKRLSLHECAGSIDKILSPCSQMTHFELVSELSGSSHSWYRILQSLPPKLEGLSILNTNQSYGDAAQFQDALKDFIEYNPMLRMLRLINDLSAFQMQAIISAIVSKAPFLDMLSLCTAQYVDLRQLIGLPCLRHLEFNHAAKNSPLIKHFIIHKQLKTLGLEDVDDKLISIVAQIEYLPVLKLTKCEASTILSIVERLPNLRELYLFKCVMNVGDIFELVETARQLQKLVVNGFGAMEGIDYAEWKKLDRKCGDHPKKLRIHVDIGDQQVNEAKLLQWNYENVDFQWVASKHLVCENDCFNIRAHNSPQTFTESIDVEYSDDLCDDVCDEDEEMDFSYVSDSDEDYDESNED